MAVYYDDGNVGLSFWADPRVAKKWVLARRSWAMKQIKDTGSSFVATNLPA